MPPGRRLTRGGSEGGHTFTTEREGRHMARITSPVKGYEGTVVGVHFADGVAETDAEGALAYFRRHGYQIDGDKTAASDESTSNDIDNLKVPELKALAKERGIDLGDAKKKDDILAKIAAATASEPDDDAKS